MAQGVPWVQKYRPVALQGVVGQDKALQELFSFLDAFPKRKAAMLHGPTGVGKTIAVHAAARKMDVELLEVNASDARDKASILQQVGQASLQRSFFGKGKIILIDEIDGVSGQQDRGALPAVVSIIEKSAVPIVLTANDIYDSKFSGLRSSCQLIDFHALNYVSITNILKSICEKEKLSVDEELLKRLARRAGGDARAAINDLQILSFGNITADAIDALADRAKTESIVQALLKILKSTDMKLALGALDTVDEDMDTVMLWLDENIPLEYTSPADVARAYDALSRADIFQSRITRRQEWRFLVYVNALLTAGVALAKDEKYKAFVPYKPSMRILRMWQLNQKHAVRKEIAGRLAPLIHMSARRLINSEMPFLMESMMKNPALLELVAAECDLPPAQFKKWIGG